MFGQLAFPLSSIDPKLPKLRLIYKDELRQMEWCGQDMKAQQVAWAVDTPGQRRFGLVMTELTERDLRKAGGKMTGNIYIKYDDPEYGLVECKMDNVVLRQIDKNVIWFKHTGQTSLHVLKKKKAKRRR